MDKYRVLLVCMGNIRRSPAAEGVLRSLAQAAGLNKQIEFDSAGTHAFHEGEAPDPRARKVASQRAYKLDGLRARRLETRDFVRFDRVLAMDHQNLAFMQRLCPPEHEAKLGLFMPFANLPGQEEIPDPYYGSSESFEKVFDMCEQAGRGFLANFKRLRGLP